MIRSTDEVFARWIPDLCSALFILFLITASAPGSFGQTSDQVISNQILSHSDAGAMIIVAPEDGRVVRRRKSLTVKWTGDLKDEKFEVHLMRGTTLVQNLGKVRNDGRYSLDIKGKLPLGQYQIKLVTSKGDVYSKSFQVKKPRVINQIGRTVWLSGVIGISVFFLYASIILGLSDSPL